MENWPTISPRFKASYKKGKYDNFKSIPKEDLDLLKTSRSNKIVELTSPKFKNNEIVILKKRTSVNADPMKLKNGEQLNKTTEWDVKIFGSFVERSKKESMNMYLVELNNEIIKVQEKYLIQLRLVGRHVKST